MLKEMSSRQKRISHSAVAVIPKRNHFATALIVKWDSKVDNFIMQKNQLNFRRIVLLCISAILASGLFTPSLSLATPSPGTSLGTAADVTISPNVSTSDSSIILNNVLSSGDSLNIIGFDTQTIRLTVSTDTGTVNITVSTGLSTVTGSGYANSSNILAAGKTIAFQGSPSNVQAALNSLQYNLPTGTNSSFSDSGTVTVSVSYAGGNTTAFNSDNGHYYIVYAATTWQSAMDATTASSNCGITFNGLCGYLATVTSETESAFIVNKVTTSASWLGGNDTQTEGVWRWPWNSPESGKILFKDSENFPGTENVNYCADGLQGYCPNAVTGNGAMYNNWNSGEPNDYPNSGVDHQEDAMQVLTGGAGVWNDLPTTGTSLQYIVEFGGKGETPDYQSRTRNVVVAFSYTYSPTTSTSDGKATQSSCIPTTVSSIAPLIGSSSGGTLITINGTGLSTASVYVGGPNAPFVSRSNTTLVVTTPAGSKGSAQIYIAGCGSVYSTFVYDPDPLISSLSSTSISTSGEGITINGNYLSGASITVDTVAATISSNTDISIIAALPSLSPGTKTLTIKTAYGSTSRTLTYLAAPTQVPSAPVISTVSTSAISTRGASITISGSNLSGASVTVDSNVALISSNTDVSISVVLPGLGAGFRSMVIKTASGSTSYTLNYISPPTISSILPAGIILLGDKVSLALSSTGVTSFTLNGALPPGLLINSATGVISGMAMKEGLFNFSVTASNAIGSETKNFTIDIDRPIPRTLSFTIYFSGKNTALSPSNKASLDRLVSQIQSVAPRNVPATFTLLGGDGGLKDALTSSRFEQVKSYLLKSGIKIKTFSTQAGDTNRISISAQWTRY